MNEITRKPFNLYDKTGVKLGWGFYYVEGNVQVYLQGEEAALQMQLADVLHLKDVRSFRWVSTEPVRKSRQKREWVRENLYKVESAGYAVVLMQNGKYGVYTPDRELLKTYKHRTRAITGALKHLQKTTP